MSKRKKTSTKKARTFHKSAVKTRTGEPQYTVLPAALRKLFADGLADPDNVATLLSQGHLANGTKYLTVRLYFKPGNLPPKDEPSEAAALKEGLKTTE